MLKDKETIQQIRSIFNKLKEINAPNNLTHEADTHISLNKDGTAITQRSMANYYLLTEEQNNKLKDITLEK